MSWPSRNTTLARNKIRKEKRRINILIVFGKVFRKRRNLGQIFERGEIGWDTSFVLQKTTTLSPLHVLRECDNRGFEWKMVDYTFIAQELNLTNPALPARYMALKIFFSTFWYL